MIEVSWALIRFDSDHSKIGYSAFVLIETNYDRYIEILYIW